MSIRIITLGTGSGKPTLMRGVSSTALIRDGEVVLFDCGEGTQLQMQHARVKSSRMGLICITHMHGDHINGLPGLLGSMSLDHREQPLTVVGPRGMRDYLSTLKRHHIFHPSYPLNLVEIPPEGGVVYSGEQFEVSALPLRHRITAFGFRWAERDRPGRFDLEAAKALGIPSGPLYGRLQRGETIELEDGRKVEPSEVVGEARRGKVIAYCTDTSPCANAVTLGRNADLLIHEGTYAAELEAQARQRGHSTVVHAAKAAAEAKAQRLLITHVSPKHTDIRALRASAREIFPRTRIARDLREYEV